MSVLGSLSRSYRGLLIDLDGVLYVQERLIPGAVETIRMLQQHTVDHRFVTNTTTHTRRQLTQRLQHVGISIQPDRVFTAPRAAAMHLSHLKEARCFFLVHPNLLEEFNGIQQDERSPTHVVIGDVGEGFNYESMNRVFNMINSGAAIVALQKNRFWMTRDGLKLDAGAFVTALEYASGKAATVFGKPSREFFLQACESFHANPSDIVMIGDDLKADIAGAASVGMQTVFVRTGKDREASLQGVHPMPDAELTSIADLAGLLALR